MQKIEKSWNLKRIFFSSWFCINAELISKICHDWLFKTVAWHMQKNVNIKKSWNTGKTINKNERNTVSDEPFKMSSNLNNFGLSRM